MPGACSTSAMSSCVAGNGQVAFRQNNRGLLTISTSAAAPEGEKTLRANDPASNATAEQGNSERLASLRIQLPAWTASSYHIYQLSGSGQKANTRLTTITEV